MDKKKLTMIGGGVAVVVLLVAGYFLFFNKPDPKKIVLSYVEALNNGEYEKMYSMITKESKEAIDEETFIKRNQNIYEGIGATNIVVTIDEIAKGEKGKTVTYQTTMQSDAGEIQFNNTMDLISEGGTYKIDWWSKLIFPDLTVNDKINVENTEAKRGSIYDRNHNALATQGEADEIGLVPGKLKEKEESIKKLSELLNISEETINTALNASWVQDDYFVPIKTMVMDEALESQVLEISGVQINTTTIRTYPYKNAAGILTGYVQSITAEELKENKGKGYTANSVIGKTGAEYIYEDELRGNNGCVISIIDQDGNTKSTIKSKKVEDGKDVTLTIDAELQNTIYQQFDKDSGTASAIHPYTGEIMALVSAPSYDPNDFIAGLTNTQWDALNNDSQKPLINRFTSTYVPGSTFKSVSALLGLENKTMTASENLGKEEGLKWQKDSSWGDYFVTTVTDYGDEVNLKNALVYSDNTYFAKVACRLGTDAYTRGLDALGFNESFSAGFDFAASTYGSNMKDEVTLANSGYGQGDILISPLHLASIYSAFLNGGNMMKPYLESNSTQSIWKENVISKENAEIIKEDLIASVETKGVSGSDAYIEGMKIGGKTGTAEVGDNELGWFIGFNDNGDQSLVIALMCENAKEQGGSLLAVHKVKAIFETLK